MKKIAYSLIFLVLFVSSIIANELNNGGFDDNSCWTGQGESGIYGGCGYVGSASDNSGAQLYQISGNAPFVEAPFYLLKARVRTSQSSNGSWGSGVEIQLYKKGWILVGGSLTFTFDNAEKAVGMNVWHDIAVEIDTTGLTQADFDTWGVTASLRREACTASGRVEFDDVSITPITTREAGCVWMAEAWCFKTDPDEEGVTGVWYATNYDDSAWSVINAGQRYEDQGYSNYDGDSWYRKWVYIPSDWSDEDIQLEFGYVDNWCNLYINGTYISRYAGSLAVDVTSEIIPGQYNLICCRIEDTGDDGGIVAKPVQLILFDPLVSIGTSKSIPTVGEQITITVAGYDAAEPDLVITNPLGQDTTYTLDSFGQTYWYPSRYGQYTLSYAYTSDSETVWVTAEPLIFHYWDDAVASKYATHVFVDLNKRPGRLTYLYNRGIVPVTWAGGAVYEYGSTEAWFQDWKNAYEANVYDGIVIDELYASNSTSAYLNSCEATVLTRLTTGADFHIGPYISGLSYDNAEGFWYLRRAGAQVLWENYYGDEDLYKKRWLDLKLFNMDKIGGVLALGPGYTSGPQTVSQFRDAIAQARRVAPEMRGLGFFNGYYYRNLDAASEHLIERFFLCPIIHIHPRDGYLVFQNIGNEDTPATITASYYNGTTFISSITLPSLVPNGEYVTGPSAGATRVVLNTPPAMENLYVNGSFTFPATLDPLQVVSCSVQENEEVSVSNGGGQVVVVLTFNNNLNTATATDSSDVWMYGSTVGAVTPSGYVYNDANKTLTVTFADLETDYYTFRLKSLSTSVKDTAGSLLDGSGDGFVEGGNDNDGYDHFAVHFKVQEENARLVAHWELDEITGAATADNSITGSHPGTLIGTPRPAWLPTGGVIDGLGALRFNGANYVNCGDIESSAMNAAMTCSAWIKINSFNVGYQAVLGKGYTAWRIIRYAATNQLMFCINSNAASTINSINVNDGQWHHIAAVYDSAANSIKLYVDGVASSSTGNGAIGTNTYNVLLGANPDQLGDASYFDGDMDNVQLYSYAFSESQVLDTYQNGFTDSELFAAHWKFDESSGSTASDSSVGGDYDGTLTGTPAPVWDPNEGVKAGSIQFNGDNYVNCGNISRATMRNSMTCAAWIKVNSFTTGYQAVLGKGYTAWRIVRNGTTNNIMFSVNSGTASTVNSTNVNDGQWHHIAAVYDCTANSIKLYVDGAVSSSTGNGLIATNAYNVLLGANPDQLGDASYFDGSMDEVRLYQYALSEAEVLALCENTDLFAHWKLDESSGLTASDSSIFGGNPGTLTGTPVPTWVPAGGVVDGAIQFNGANYVNCGDIETPEMCTAMTCTAWIKVNSFTVGYQAVLGKGYTAWRIIRDAASNNIMFSINSGTASTVNSTNVNDGQWHHIAAVYDSAANSIKLYVDGVASSSTGNGAIGTNAYSIMLGVNPDQLGDPSYFNGYMDDVRLYQYALTQAEVEALLP